MTDEIAQKYSQAENFIREGKELFAVQIYKQLLDEKKETRSTMLRLAHLYEKMKLFDKVSELIENYLDERNDAEVEFLYGQFLMRVKKFSKAIEIFGKTDKSSRADIYYFCGVARYESGDFKGARESFDDYLNSGDKRYRDKALFANVNASLKLKNYDDALSYLDLLDKISGLERARIFTLYAKAYFGKGLFYYAQDAVLKAIKKKGYDKELYYLAGKIHFNLGEYADAGKFFTALTERGVHSAEIYALLGFTALAESDFETAKKRLTAAMEINPYDKNVILLKNKLMDLQNVETGEN